MRRVNLIQTALGNVIAIKTGARQELFDLSANQSHATAEIKDAAIRFRGDLRRDESRLVSRKVISSFAGQADALIQKFLIGLRELIELAR